MLVKFAGLRQPAMIRQQSCRVVFNLFACVVHGQTGQAYTATELAEDQTRYDVIELISSYECPRMTTSCRVPRTRRHTSCVSRGKSRDVMTNVKAVRLFILETNGGLH